MSYMPRVVAGGLGQRTSGIQVTDESPEFRLDALENPPRAEINGEVVMPKEAPGGNAKLAIATVQYDTAGYWDATNKRYTPQKAGVYWVACFILDVGAATLANKFMGIQIKRNKARIGENLEMRMMQAGIAEAGLQGGYSLLAVMNGSTDFLEIFGNLSDATAGRKSIATMSVIRLGK